MTERYFWRQQGTKFSICDLTTSGLGSAEHPLAVCFDSEVAERLVGLLNNDWLGEVMRAHERAGLAPLLSSAGKISFERRPAAQEDGLDT